MDTYFYYVYTYKNTPELLKLGCLVFNYLLATALWWKYSTTHQDETGDPVSDLPDDVLSKILSPFTVKDAAHLSTVSKRWKRGVSASVSNLVFNWDTMFKDRYPCYSEEDCCTRYKDRYVRGVNQFLQFLKCPKIVRFEVANFCLREESTEDVDAWIRYAVDRGVEKLNLLLFCTTCGCNATNRYVVRPELLRGSRLKILTLHSCLFARGLFNKQRLQYLKQLKFVRMRIVERDVNTILCGCLNLEFLVFTHCYLPVKLCISVPDLKLNKFYVRNCFDVEEIELSTALNLIWFEYFGSEIKFSFCGALSVRKVSIRVPSNSEESVLMNVLQTLPPIETMTVNAATNWLNCLPVVGAKAFSAIKELSVHSTEIMDFDIQKLAYILDTCPVLEKLFLVTKFCRGPRDLPLHCLHKNLKLVSLGGFHRIWNQIEFVKYILECCTALEQLHINRATRVHAPGGWITLDRKYWSVQDGERIRDLLQGFLMKTTRLLLL